MRFSGALGVTPAQPQLQAHLSAHYRRPGWLVGATVEGPLRTFSTVGDASVSLEGMQFGVEGCRMWHLFHLCLSPTVGFREAIVDGGTSGWRTSERQPHVTAQARTGVHFRIDRIPNEPGGMYLELGAMGGLNITRTVIVFDGREIWEQPLGFGQLYVGFRADIYP